MNKKLDELEKIIYIESKIDKVKLECPEFENFSLNDKMHKVFTTLAITEHKIYDENEISCFVRAFLVPFDKLNEDLNEYDNSSPKVDEIKFINSLSYKYHVSESLVKQRIRDIRKINSYIEKNQEFSILAVPCRRPFVVAPDKVEAFKNSTNSKEDNDFVRRLAETFRKNNLVEDKPKVKKIRQKTDKK